MNLWLLTRTDSVGYDEHDSAVIRAESEEHARRIAGENLYPKRVWSGISTVTCVPLSPDGKPGIVVSSFNAG